MTQASTQLEKTLGLTGAIALALGICLGAGLLVLTGLAYQRSGGAAIYAWLIDGVIIFPMLVIMAYQGMKNPTAEGVAGIVRTAFGPAAAVAVQVLLIGTFSLGLPGISIVGGNYFAFLVDGGRNVAILASVSILVLTGASNFFGARLSGNIQRVFTFGLLVIIALVAISGLFFSSHEMGSGISPVNQWQEAIPSMGVIFFAFAGWILVASTVEEYKNPQRDYPLTIFITFAIVLGLYLLIALATQLILPRNDSNLTTAPVAAILSAVVGVAGGKFIALIGVLIVTANLNGATWGFSRLIMASARTGFLPSRLSKVNPKTKVPGNAVMATTALILIVLSLYVTHVVTLSTLLQLAGQNFFILYFLCVVSFVKQARGIWLRSIGIVLTILYLFRVVSYQLELVYPLVLISSGVAIFYLGNLRRGDSLT